MSKIRGWVEAALEGSGWTFEEIERGLAQGDFHLLVHPEGCMIAEFVVSPRHKVLHVFAAGGSLKAMDDLGPTVEAFGRLHGCDYAAATGRKGWVKYAKRHGYSQPVYCIEKEL